MMTVIVFGVTGIWPVFRCLSGFGMAVNRALHLHPIVVVTEHFLYPLFPFPELLGMALIIA
jgi:hypothetical protein